MSQALTIRFATDVSAAKKGMADLAGSIAGNMAKISSTMLSAGKTVDQGLLQSVLRTTAGISALQVALGAGVFAGFALLTAAIDQANEQLDRYIKLGQQAEKVGVGVDFFQKFIASAGDAKGSVEALEKAIGHAGKEARENFEQASETRKLLGNLFSTGYTGDFQSKGLQQFDQAGNAEGRIRATLVAMRELQDLGLKLAAIKVGETMFGEDFAERLRQGKIDIDAMIASLEGARGAEMITSEQVERANDLRDRIEKAKDEIAAAIGLSFSLAGAGNAVLNVWAGILETVAKAVKAMASWGAPTQAEVDSRIRQQTDRDQRRRNINSSYDQMGGMGSRDEQAQRQAAESRARTAGFRQSEIGFRNSQGTEVTAPIPQRRPLDLFLNPPGSKAKGGGSPASEGLDRVESFINALRRSKEVLEAELENLGKSNVEREKAIELAKAAAAARAAGRDLTDDERTKIIALAEAQSKLKDKILDVKQAQQQAAETARYFGDLVSDSLGAMIFDGAKAQDVLRNLVSQLGKAAIQAMLLGSGPLAGLFGTAPPASAGGNAVGGLFGLVGGFFKASGGDVRAGRAYTVGELGREIFVPQADGTVMPVRRGAGSSGGGTMSISHAPTYNITPASGVTAEQLAAVIDRNNQQFARNLGPMLNRFQARFA